MCVTCTKSRAFLFLPLFPARRASLLTIPVQFSLFFSFSTHSQHDDFESIRNNDSSSSCSSDALLTLTVSLTEPQCTVAVATDTEPVITILYLLWRRCALCAVYFNHSAAKKKSSFCFFFPFENISNEHWVIASMSAAIQCLLIFRN